MSAPALRDHILARATLARAPLTDEQLEQLVLYYSLLERWNQKINLTALPLAARENATVDRLIIEPLLAAQELSSSELTWFDFGSGGGSPAVPMKIVRPLARLTMIESRERKAAFLREVVRVLGLHNTTVESVRIEELLRQPLFATADVVTIRAVRADAQMLGYARAILKPGGRLLLFRGVCSELPNAQGFELSGERPLEPGSGILSTLQKTS